MKLELKKINWQKGKEPLQTQVMTVKIRKKSDPDDEQYYKVVTTDLQVLSSGILLDPPSVTGLEADTSYVVRISNNNPDGGHIDIIYDSPQEFVIENVDNSTYYHDSELVYTEPGSGFLDTMLPPKSGAYYSFQLHGRDLFGKYYDMNAMGNLTKREHLVGMEIPTNYAPFMQIKASDILGANGEKQYAFGVFMYIAAADLPATGEWPIWLCRGSQAYAYLYVDCATKLLHWRQGSWVNTTQKEEIVSTTAILTDTWNRILVYKPVISTDAKMWLNDNDTSTGSFTKKNVPGEYDTAMYLGKGAKVNGGEFIGPKTILRNFYYTDIAIDNNLAAKFLNPQYPVGVLENTDHNGITTRYEIERKYMIQLTNDSITYTIPPTAPVGLNKFYIRNGNVTTPIKYVRIAPMLQTLAPIMVDFENAPESAVDALKFGFLPVARSLVGVNDEIDDSAGGGAAPENIYVQDDLLVLEAHGDNYDGEVQGYDLYGKLKFHSSGDDPQYGQIWRKRVGAAISSKEYCGYGRYKVVAKLPSEMGVAPAFWTFHDRAVNLQDPMYEQLQGPGKYPKYLDSGPSFIQKSQIQMQLPSHNSMYVFNTVEEMLMPHYYIAWQGEKVGVTADPDAANNGTWQLNNPAAPNVRSSWSKVNNEVQILSRPQKNNIKYNNWKGIRGDGTGMAFGADPIIDEYSSMLTSLSKNVWDGAFHEFRFDWFADRVEFFLDGEKVQTNTHFVPDIPGRWTIGLWFPSPSNNGWAVNPYSAWAGPSANWRYQKMWIKHISHEPFSDAIAGGSNLLLGETYPFAGLKAFQTPQP